MNYQEAGGIRVVQTKEYNFGRFAKDPEYRRLNRELLAQCIPYLPKRFWQVDLASGDGLVPQEMNLLCEREGKVGTIICIDLDPLALEHASINTPSLPFTIVEFVKGRAQSLKSLVNGRIPTMGADIITILNSIHEMEFDEQGDVLTEAAANLSPGGLLVYNSAFTTAALTREYGVWKANTVSLSGGERIRQFAFKIRKPEEYRAMIEQTGLTVVHDDKKSVWLGRSALEDISIYPPFIEGFFQDIEGNEKWSLEEKSEMIVEALHRTLERFKTAGFFRIWHEIVAQKPPLTAVAV